jgi:hypothetical protein
MLYHVTRNGQTYGPYTLEDLQRYVASGNVLPSDLARGEGMSEWIPVAQILGSAPGSAGPMPPPAMASYNPVYGAPPVAPVYDAAAPGYNDPPNLSWGLLLVISIFTCTIFMYVWNIVLAAWMKRRFPKSTALYLYIGAAVLLALQMMTGARVHVQMGDLWTYYYSHPLRNVIGVFLWVTKLIARFVFRSDLEEYYNTVEPVGLQLSPVMTFFFGGIYFQYHLNRINELKRLARYRGAAI